MLIRICFVGDSLTLGTGDAAALGWPGRVVQREAEAGHEISLYNLGIRGDTTALIKQRWRRECEARLPEIHQRALVFSFGVNDAAAQNDGSLRVAPEESLKNAEEIIAEAKAWLPTLWIGPTPIDPERQPYQSAVGLKFTYDNARIAGLSDAFAQIAGRLDVPYLDLFTPLSASDAWSASFQLEDGVHPTQSGYGMMAERVAGWSAWRNWFEYVDELRK